MNKLYRLWKNIWRKSRFHRRRATLVLVTNQWEKCPHEPERKICQYLHHNGYYPSLDYQLPYVCANIALVPYQIALVRTLSPTLEKKISRQLNRIGWTVFFYDEAHLTDRCLLDILKEIATPRYKVQE
ncbi:hypothetical protein [Shouchella lonarensis]|uniref:Uncharacterized protein n=1 Tax=Shouchella lonarensis TaxID=1464122 RepID=A0A1G6K0T4_9BACI|nr:hypothetical protein [Shouchella lonarensis]SDC24610.1 hypothetical protein SAMN05421737_106155 [Shouchella lonarensis]